MRFIVDMPLSPDLAHWLSSLNHDAVHVSERGMYNAPDDDILRLVLEENRVVITADLDFPRLLATLQAEAPGLILLRGGNYSDEETIECVRRVLMSLEPEALAASIVVVDKTKIRRRRLPV